MSKTKRFEHRFVTSAPRELEADILYVSMEFATALHHCACGCGSRIVTPFSPTDWNMGFDGLSVTLNPSVGNWSLPCRSHYFIHCGVVKWASDWSQQQVLQNRSNDRLRKRPVERSKHIVKEVSRKKLTDVPWFNRLRQWMTIKWW